MKQTIAAVLLGVLAGVAACSGARGSGQGRESTATALDTNAGRGGFASPWLDDPDSQTGTAASEAAPAVEESESSDEGADDAGDGGGDDDGDEGGDDLVDDAAAPEVELDEDWGGDEDWDEDDPGDE
jgi:hypothetical protein